jgi:hypothetical protein
MKQIAIEFPELTGEQHDLLLEMCNKYENTVNALDDKGNPEESGVISNSDFAKKLIAKLREFIPGALEYTTIWYAKNNFWQIDSSPSVKIKEEYCMNTMLRGGLIRLPLPPEDSPFAPVMLEAIKPELTPDFVIQLMAVALHANAADSYTQSQAYHASQQVKG